MHRITYNHCACFDIPAFFFKYVIYLSCESHFTLYKPLKLQSSLLISNISIKLILFFSTKITLQQESMDYLFFCYYSYFSTSHLPPFNLSSLLTQDNRKLIQLFCFMKMVEMVTLASSLFQPYHISDEYRFHQFFSFSSLFSHFSPLFG